MSGLTSAATTEDDRPDIIPKGLNHSDRCWEVAVRKDSTVPRIVQSPTAIAVDGISMNPEIVLVITKGTLVITAEVLVTTNEALVTTAGVLVTTNKALVITAGILVTTNEVLVITAEVLVTTNKVLVITAGVLVTTKIILGVIRTMFRTINANKTVISSKNTC